MPITFSQNVVSNSQIIVSFSQKIYQIHNFLAKMRGFSCQNHYLCRYERNAIHHDAHVRLSVLDSDAGIGIAS